MPNNHVQGSTSLACCRPLSKSTPIQYHALEILGIARTRIKSKPRRWLRWEKPPDGCYKLNVDGSARLEAITGGGIICDHQGVLVAAFSSSYVQGTNNIAEFAALLEELQLCRDLDLHNVIIESDSSIVVSAMKQKQVENWKLTYSLRQCLDLLRVGYQITHVLRQKNTVADCLAEYVQLHNGNLE